MNVLYLIISRPTHFSKIKQENPQVADVCTVEANRYAVIAARIDQQDVRFYSWRAACKSRWRPKFSNDELRA
jgi:hypothetical protein